MRSVSDNLTRSVAVAACVGLLGVGAAGCSTTQEKAEHQKARAEHILKAREDRQQARKRAKAAKDRHHGHKGKAK